jgi:hypothetical protein
MVMLETALRNHCNDRLLSHKWSREGPDVAPNVWGSVEELPSGFVIGTSGQHDLARVAARDGRTI